MMRRRGTRGDGHPTGCPLGSTNFAVNNGGVSDIIRYYQILSIYYQISSIYIYHYNYQYILYITIMVPVHI